MAAPLIWSAAIAQNVWGSRSKVVPFTRSMAQHSGLRLIGLRLVSLANSAHNRRNFAGARANPWLTSAITLGEHDQRHIGSDVAQHVERRAHHCIDVYCHHDFAAVAVKRLQNPLGLRGFVTSCNLGEVVRMAIRVQDPGRRSHPEPMIVRVPGAHDQTTTHGRTNPRLCKRS